VLVAAALAVAALPGLAPARSDVSQSPFEASLLREINHIRSAHGLRPVAASIPLARAADAHTASMGRLGYFAHDSADGTRWDKRIARFYPHGKTSYWMVGENLLFASGAVVLTTSAAVAMWMESPEHRRNILEPRWRSVGISELFVPHAPGDFGGEDTVLLVTDFGARS